MDPNQTPQEPTPSQTTEPTTDPAPATEQVPGTFAEPAPQPQQTTEPQSSTATEPEPTEPEPTERVVPKPEEYTLPEGMPEQLRSFAHDQGFTQDQLDASLQQFGGYMQGMQQSHLEALRKAGEAHVANWGSEANTKLSLAKAAVRQNDPDGKLMKALNESGWGNHPDVLDFLYNIGKSMQEGGFIKSTVPKRPGQKTAAEAMYGENHPTKG